MYGHFGSVAELNDTPKAAIRERDVWNSARISGRIELTANYRSTLPEPSFPLVTPGASVNGRMPKDG